MSKKRKINADADDIRLETKRQKNSDEKELSIFSLPPEIIKELLYYLITPDCAR